MVNYEYLTIEEIRKMLKEHQTTALELVQYFIDRIKKYGLADSTNSICAINPNVYKEAKKLDDLVSKGYDLPLLGIPYIVKDNIDVKGMPTTAGSVFLADNIAASDSKVVKLLKSSGAICIAKANLKELANFIGSLPDGYSSYGGRVISGFGEEFMVGGSSSGSAVACSIGLSVFTLGTDTSYSVIHCAGLNGVIGFKPNVKKISQAGVVPISKYLDAVGVFTRCLDDLEAVINVILKKKNSIIPINKPSYSVGIDNCKKEELSSEYQEQLNRFVSKMKELNIRTQETYFPNQPYIYELMKRDYAISFNNYLNKSSATIKSFEELLNAYQNNPDSSKYGIHILVQSNDFSKEKDNEEKINGILNTIRNEKKKFMQMLNKYDVVIETGLTSAIHIFNVPSISIPFTNTENGVPMNIIMYAKDESMLISFSKSIMKLIDKDLIYNILDKYK